MPWKRHPWMRAAYSTMYLFFTLAGILAFFFPAQAILDAVQSSLVYAWAAFLTAGGGLSLISPTRNTWFGELLGLPLLSTSNVVFGLSLLGYGKTAAAIAIGLVFLGFGFGLLGRWFDIRRLAGIAGKVGDNGS